jgi:hypothetical protein
LSFESLLARHTSRSEDGFPYRTRFDESLGFSPSYCLPVFGATPAPHGLDALNLVAYLLIKSGVRHVHQAVRAGVGVRVLVGELRAE